MSIATARRLHPSLRYACLAAALEWEQSSTKTVVPTVCSARGEIAELRQGLG